MGNVLDCASENRHESFDEINENSTEAYNILEHQVPLPQSLLWTLQKDFYEKHNIKCWSKSVVPSFVTSNSFICQIYANTIFSYLRDLSSANCLQEPLYIIEIGSGSGKFAFILLQKLMEMHPYLPSLGDHSQRIPFRYVITDFSPKIISFLATHPPLKTYIDMGILDLAVFDMEKDTEFRLIHSGIILSQGITESPIVVIGNYIFNSVIQDAFHVGDGTICQSRISIISSQAEEDTPSSDILDRITCLWSYPPINPGSDLYGDPKLNKFVIDYARSFTMESTIIVPIALLGFLNNMQKISNGKLLLLSGDKGYCNKSQMEGYRDPHLAFHGSFSCMVNFDALHDYVASCGGFSLSTPYEEGFKCTLSFFGHDQAKFKETCCTWIDAVATFGPESFSCLQRGVLEDCKNPSLRSLLAVLRCGYGDSDVLYKYRNNLITRCSGANLNQNAVKDIQRDFTKVIQCYYPLQKSKDICFEIARILMGMKEFRLALDYLDRSIEHCGNHHVTMHNTGICYAQLGEYSKALDAFESCLEQNATYADAIHWRNTIKSLMNDTSQDPLPLLATRCDVAKRDVNDCVISSMSPLERSDRQSSTELPSHSP